MANVRRLLREHADRIDPSHEWLGGVLRKFQRRRQRRRVATAFVAVAVAGLGLVLAARAFLPSERVRPAQAEPQYRFENLSVAPGDVDPGQTPEDRETATIRFTVDFEGYPGARLCTFQVLDDHGSVVGTQRVIFALRHPYREMNEGRPAMEVAVTGDPATVTVQCAPRRLDTPGIAELEAFPANMPSPPANTSGALEPGPAEDIIRGRVEGWAGEYNVGAMSSDLISANLAALRRELARVSHGDFQGYDWWVANELWARTLHLQELLEARGESEIRSVN
jgi:hypothetical protein